MIKWIKRLFKQHEPSNNPVPTFTITCTIEDDTGYRVEADWDDSFIQSLRLRGYADGSDDAIVGHWMMDMYLMQSSKMSKDGQAFV